ncbi:hypothetical protein [Edaphovirga cremea]|uniref:hypothetical protein n=1 Tax=Edaphovirga cremea TaxID=2267246 RepID=UPI000DEF4268|nr:hypothetical protein [Edaphovirga cremea]
MINFLKKWLKAQLSYFFWGYVPLIVVVIFGVAVAQYFPGIAVQATGIFFVVVLIFVFWFNYKH